MIYLVFQVESPWRRNFHEVKSIKEAGVIIRQFPEDSLLAMTRDKKEAKNTAIGALENAIDAIECTKKALLADD